MLFGAKEKWVCCSLSREYHNMRSPFRSVKGLNRIIDFPWTTDTWEIAVWRLFMENQFWVSGGGLKMCHKSKTQLWICISHQYFIELGLQAVYVMSYLLLWLHKSKQILLDVSNKEMFSLWSLRWRHMKIIHKWKWGIQQTSRLSRPGCAKGAKTSHCD